MAKDQNPIEPSKRLRLKPYLIIALVAVALVGASVWVTRQNQSPGLTPETLQTGTLSSAASASTYSALSTVTVASQLSSSTTSVVPFQPSDFNNLSYVGCVMKGSMHTYLRLNITITNRFNATVDYVNASIVFQASQISNGFHASENYTQEVAGPTYASTLKLSLSLPIDNVVSGSVRIEVFVERASNQVEAVVLQPSMPLSPSDYQLCVG